MVTIGKLFYIYKLFYRKLFKIAFFIIKKAIIFIWAKDIEVILNLDSWVNARSVFFFYTNIQLDFYKLKGKQYPVKKFKVKWYLWVIHYVWAAWVIIKIIIYMTIYYSFRYIFKGIIFKHLWLILLEYWRYRFPIILIFLYVFWYSFHLYRIGKRTFRYLYREKHNIVYKILVFLRIYKIWVKICVFKLKYFWTTDKHPCTNY